MATTDLATDLTKNYVGRLRPFFFEKCDFDEEDATCRLPQAQQDLLRQSFPSGHASLGTCAMLFTTLYLLGKVGSPASPGKLVLQLPWGLQPLRLAPAAALMATLPLWLSSWIMCSRVHDNWHHPADVATGAVLGGVVATLWYALGYPPVFGPDSHVPLVSPARETELENGASTPAADVMKEKRGLVV
jgi:membrane-associated phospholipid phosphatase